MLSLESSCLTLRRDYISHPPSHVTAPCQQNVNRNTVGHFQGQRPEAPGAHSVLVLPSAERASSGSGAGQQQMPGHSMHAQSLWSCSPLCNVMDCSPSSSPVHEILQARMLSGWPFPSPEDLPDPWIKPTSPATPALAGGLFITEPPEKPHGMNGGPQLST